ncbi:GNAT family N-acetyltransferase [Halobacteriovorax sp. DPLXC-1]|uniref:GNAT family N-acetyltransferase n=1 Tax=Halobacteriovorax sp. DPLXC-1 TaxID=3110771 RepID=UPI002FF2FDF5
MLKKLEWDSSFFNKSIYSFENSLEILREINFDNYDRDSIIYYFSDKLIPELSSFLVDEKIVYSKRVQHEDFFVDNQTFFCLKPTEKDRDIFYKFSIDSSHMSRFRKSNLFKDDLVDKLYMKWIDRAYDNMDLYYFICNVEQEKINSLVLIKVEDKKAQIEIVATAKDVRGQGIGKRSLEFSLNKLEQMHVEDAFVTTQLSNVPACRLYERCGFKRYDLKYIYHIQVKDLVK